MKLDLLLDPFGAHWPEVRDAAHVAADAGFDGLWTWDHLAGSAHGQDRVLECWTVLTALAVEVPGVAIGPMVLNVANRRPGVLATMAATLQEVSGGRLVLGIGAGGGKGLPYPKEQEAIGAEVGPDPVRRQQVREAVHVLRQLWTGRARPYQGEWFSLGEADGFLRPEPPPPIVIGAFGPKMAAIAGEIGDGINTHGNSPQLPVLLQTAREAHQAVGRDPDDFLVTVGAPLDPRTVRGTRLPALAELGVHRLVMLCRPPFDLDGIRAVAAARPAGP